LEEGDSTHRNRNLRSIPLEWKWTRCNRNRLVNLGNRMFGVKLTLALVPFMLS